MTRATDPQAEAQAVMSIAQVVKAANDEHARRQRLRLLGQGAGAAS
jgi:hypothetical protein